MFEQYHEKKLLTHIGRRVETLIHSPHDWEGSSGSLSVMHRLCDVIQIGLRGSQDTCFVQPE